MVVSVFFLCKNKTMTIHKDGNTFTLSSLLLVCLHWPVNLWQGILQCNFLN